MTPFDKLEITTSSTFEVYKYTRIFYLSFFLVASKNLHMWSSALVAASNKQIKEPLTHISDTQQNHLSPVSTHGYSQLYCLFINRFFHNSFDQINMQNSILPKTKCSIKTTIKQFYPITAHTTHYHTNIQHMQCHIPCSAISMFLQGCILTSYYHSATGPRRMPVHFTHA